MKIYIILAAVLSGAGVVIWYGHTRYQDGARDAAAEFMRADQEGASDARKTAERVLRDLGGVDDPDELLRRTGGLRD